MNDIEKELLSLDSEKTTLQSELTAGKDYGDWKIVKCYECNLLGIKSPYNIQNLHEKRQKARDRINEIEQKFLELSTKKQSITY